MTSVSTVRDTIKYFHGLGNALYIMYEWHICHLRPKVTLMANDRTPLSCASVPRRQGMAQIEIIILRLMSGEWVLRGREWRSQGTIRAESGWGWNNAGTVAGESGGARE